MSSSDYFWAPFMAGERRHTPAGRVLHCCCMCGTLNVWSDEWSWYGSIREQEGNFPLAKFCSPKCATRGEGVNDAMKRIAAEREYGHVDGRESGMEGPKSRSLPNAAAETERTHDDAKPNPPLQPEAEPERQDKE